MNLGDRPAFPVTQVYPQGDLPGMKGKEGMTLRQAYKMAALQGLLARREPDEFSEAAEWAGRYADAMIAEDLEHEKKGEVK